MGIHPEAGEDGQSSAESCFISASLESLDQTSYMGQRDGMSRIVVAFFEPLVSRCDFTGSV
jgi:hypothetical protein